MTFTKTIFVSSLKDGQRVNDLFLIGRKSLAETRAGKPYLSLTLMDRSGEIEARAWDNALSLDKLAGVGEVIVLQGQVKSYQNQNQFIVSGMELAIASQVDLCDYMPSSSRPSQKMADELAGLIATLCDQGLRELLAVLFSGQTLAEFSIAPAAKRMHHAYLGGLIEHSLSVAAMAVKTAQHYPNLDRDILLAGALVHDIAKIREFSYRSVPFEYTDNGRLLGHLVLGGEMIRDAARGIKAEILPTRRVDELIHLVLSHHGRHDFGAPVLPMTPEAILLHYLDDMDAKVNYIESLRKKQEEPGWSDFQRPLERFLYLQPLAEEGEMGDPFQGSSSCNLDMEGEDNKLKCAKKDSEQRQQSLF